MLLVNLHYGSYMAMGMEVKVQARRTEKSLCETERQACTKLFLQEKDYWHESSVHQEYVLGKMFHSTEYVGVKERQHYITCHPQWGQLLSKTRMAPEAKQNTAFEQIGSTYDQEFILCLCGECLSRAYLH